MCDLTLAFARRRDVRLGREISLSARLHPQLYWDLRSDLSVFGCVFFVVWFGLERRHAVNKITQHRAHVPFSADPRFEGGGGSGKLNYDIFRKAYGFLGEYQDSEIEELKKSLKKEKNQVMHAAAPHPA